MASSWDGWNWSRPERRPIVTRETEDGEYSCIYASPSLVPLADGWGVPYHGNFELHDWGQWPKSVPDGEYRWAQWKPERLVSIWWVCVVQVPRYWFGTAYRTPVIS